MAAADIDVPAAIRQQKVRGCLTEFALAGAMQPGMSFETNAGVFVDGAVRNSQGTSIAAPVLQQFAVRKVEKLRQDGSIDYTEDI